MNNSGKLHIYEEASTLFWGLLAVTSTAMATFLLANTFFSAGWSISGFRQLLVLGLFALSFTAIFKVTDPLLHFIIYVDQSQLFIEVFKGEYQLNTITIGLDEIEALKFTSYQERSDYEALYDFSTSYQLMWKGRSGAGWKPLIDLETDSFTLKVEDIAKIIRYIRRHNPEISVPEEQKTVFNI